MSNGSPAAAHYFATIKAALSGFETYVEQRGPKGPVDGFAAGVLEPYLKRLMASFSCWEAHAGFAEQFRISRADSGFPVFQNVLELENDRASAESRLASIPPAQALREEMADFILRQKSFPSALQQQMAERIYLEQIGEGAVFSPAVLPDTLHVSVNPKTMRPVYHVAWGIFDGSQTLPMVYLAAIEDSSEEMVKLLVTKDGRLNPDADIPLPVGGLLNPRLAVRFDDFVVRNGAYSLTPATIAVNLDQDFPELHPKVVRRLVLGPLYSAGITENNGRVNEVLSKVRNGDNAWMFTWTMQEIFSKRERPEKKGFFSTAPAAEEFHIETNDLEATRMGVSAYEKHALVPHDAYQALYAAGEADSIFGNYKVHVISSNRVISEV